MGDDVKKPTIAELERLLEQNPEGVHILPSGELVVDSDHPQALRLRCQSLEGMLRELITEWGNRGETTSLHDWHGRMKIVIARAQALLGESEARDA